MNTSTTKSSIGKLISVDLFAETPSLVYTIKMETHEKFQKYLRESVPPVFAVAQWLHLRGNDIQIPGFNVAGKASESDAFSDGGDIMLPGKGVIDVKSLKSIVFSDDPAQFQYPQCAAGWKPSIDKIMPNLIAAFIVSGDLKAAFIVRKAQYESATVRDITDRVTGKPKPSYFISKDMAEFISLE